MDERARLAFLLTLANLMTLHGMIEVGGYCIVNVRHPRRPSHHDTHHVTT